MIRRLEHGLESLSLESQRRAIADAVARINAADAPAAASSAAALPQPDAAEPPLPEPPPAAAAPVSPFPPPAPPGDDDINRRLSALRTLVVDKLVPAARRVAEAMPPAPPVVTLTAERVATWVTCRKSSDARATDGRVSYAEGDERGGVGAAALWSTLLSTAAAPLAASLGDLLRQTVIAGRRHTDVIRADHDDDGAVEEEAAAPSAAPLRALVQGMALSERDKLCVERGKPPNAHAQHALKLVTAWLSAGARRAGDPHCTWPLYEGVGKLLAYKLSHAAMGKLNHDWGVSCSKLTGLKRLTELGVGMVQTELYNRAMGEDRVYVEGSLLPPLLLLLVLRPRAAAPAAAATPAAAAATATTAATTTATTKTTATTTTTSTTTTNPPPTPPPPPPPSPGLAPTTTASASRGAGSRPPRRSGRTPRSVRRTARSCTGESAR